MSWSSEMVESNKSEVFPVLHFFLICGPVLWADHWQAAKIKEITVNVCVEGEGRHNFCRHRPYFATTGPPRAPKELGIATEPTTTGTPARDRRAPRPMALDSDADSKVANFNVDG